MEDPRFGEQVGVDLVAPYAMSVPDIAQRHTLCQSVTGHRVAPYAISVPYQLGIVTIRYASTGHRVASA
eukprot:1060603-Rhodomonas_salina.1